MFDFLKPELKDIMGLSLSLSERINFKCRKKKKFCLHDMAQERKVYSHGRKWKRGTFLT
jgi:hypothetical protein